MCNKGANAAATTVVIAVIARLWRGRERGLLGNDWEHLIFNLIFLIFIGHINIKVPVAHQPIGQTGHKK